MVFFFPVKKTVKTVKSVFWHMKPRPKNRRPESVTPSKYPSWRSAADRLGRLIYITVTVWSGDGGVGVKKNKVPCLPLIMAARVSNLIKKLGGKTSKHIITRGLIYSVPVARGSTSSTRSATTEATGSGSNAADRVSVLVTQPSTETEISQSNLNLRLVCLWRSHSKSVFMVSLLKR